MRKIKLHLIRHPRPVIAPGICYGQLDVVAEGAEIQAKQLRERLQGIPLWTSPLQRCRTFAERIDLAVRVDRRLMEMNFGDWEGQAWENIDRFALDAWAADLWNFAPPGGESALEVWQRLRAFLVGVEDSEIALITHAGIIRLLLAQHTTRPLDETLSLNVPYAELTQSIAFVIF